MTDCGDENPLHMDFYGFPPAVCETGPLEVETPNDYRHHAIDPPYSVQVEGKLCFLVRDCRNVDESNCN